MVMNIEQLSGASAQIHRVKSCTLENSRLFCPLLNRAWENACSRHFARNKDDIVIDELAGGSVTHNIPPEYISESVLLKIIESDLLTRNGYVDRDDVIQALMKHLVSEDNIILNDIYRQTLEFVVGADR